jgi:putative endonuclease
VGNREEGQAGEESAVKALKRKGYKIIERNYRTRLGEIDVIAEEDGCLVFVEVKKRNTGLFGEAVCSIDDRKKKHMVNAALYYLKAHRAFSRRIRFDVIGIDADKVKLVKNAFMVEEEHG